MKRVCIFLLLLVATAALAQNVVKQAGISYGANGPCSPILGTVGYCGDDPTWSGVPQLVFYDALGNKYPLTSFIVPTQGPAGPPGAAATIAVGQVSSGPTPAVSNVGTGNAAVLDFVLQAGGKGDKGDAGAPGTGFAIGTKITFNITCPKGSGGVAQANGWQANGCVLTITNLQ